STTADFSSGVQTVGTTGADKAQMVDMLPQTAGATYSYRVRALGTPTPSAYSPATEGVTPGAAASRTDIVQNGFGDAATQALWTLNTAQFRDADGDPNGTLERLMLTDALDGQTGSA